MPEEIEIKLKYEDHERVRRRLRDLGAQCLGQFLESNIFFDTPEHTLEGEDRGVRLRTSTNTATGSATHIITYKGPRAPGPVKRREEIELAVESADCAVALLGALGYIDMLAFEKRRESWRFDDCEIDLDELPHLGRFVEIEGLSESAVLALRAKLELNDAPSVVAPYIALVARYVEGKKLTVRDVRF